MALFYARNDNKCDSDSAMSATERTEAWMTWSLDVSVALDMTGATGETSMVA
jgi:hypothetical protein